MGGKLGGEARGATAHDAGASTGLHLAAAGLGLLAGVALQLRQADVWPLTGYLALAGIALPMLLAAIRCRRRLALRCCAAPALLMLGFALTGTHACWRLADALDPGLEGADVQLVGVVANLPQANSSGVRFQFEVESARLAGRALRSGVPPLLAIGWYRGWNDEAALADPAEGLHAGQRWRFTARLRMPHGSLNPEGFDYELWLFEQGLRATGYVRATDGDAPKLLDEAAGYRIERLRQRVRDAIDTRVHEARAAGVLTALAVGDQAAIDREGWDLFRNTGIAHLVSISGLHVTMFAWLAGALIGLAWRRSTRLMLLWPTPAAARWGGVLAAWAYAVFSGWGVPSQRTVWMLATAALLQSGSRRWPWPLVLLAAGVVVAAVDPWALLQPGFWLSFCAVGLLMASAPVWPRQKPSATAPPAGPPWRRLISTAGHAGREVLRTQAVATLGLTPLTLVFFQQLSIVGFVANLVAIPLVTLLITPLALLGILAPPLWLLGAWLVHGFTAWLAWLAAWPGAVWTVPVAPGWAQALGLLGGALAIMPLPWRLRLLAVPLVLPLMWPARTLPGDGEFELIAADVGQGTAVLLRTRSHLLVFDSGPQYSRENDAGQRVLVPLLRARGEKRIDRLILSHSDTDHIGGAASLMQALPTAELWSSLPLDHRLLPMAASATRCAAGQHWQWDGVQFELLHPRPEGYGLPGVKPNALSCVLRVRGAQHSALLTGDVEKEGEAQMIASYGAAGLRSELLVAPHHGSRTSSTAAFLDAVHPDLAIFQAGYRNRFGHPAPDVLVRYRERGIRVLTSPACGALVFAPVDAPQRTICERVAVRRYWHHRLPPDATD